MTIELKHWDSVNFVYTIMINCGYTIFICMRMKLKHWDSDNFVYTVLINFSVIYIYVSEMNWNIGIPLIFSNVLINVRLYAL